MKIINKVFLWLIIIVMLFIPVVQAEEYKKVQIQVDVSMKEDDLGSNEFEFILKDQEGNIIQIKKNDQEGKVIFDEIEVENTPEVPILYVVEQVLKDPNKYKYDTHKAYVRIFDNEIKYYKENIEELQFREEKIKHNSDSKAFHATENDLKGQAYAKLDLNTFELVFFRDTEGKYTNKYQENNTIYYTGFEENTENNSWPLNYGWRENNIGRRIKKVTFQDAIKPNIIRDWFASLESLEEIDLAKLDTSLVTNLDNLFINNVQLKRLDLSTFDVANVTRMENAFQNCISLEEIIIYNWDATKITSLMSFLSNTGKLKYIDFQNFNNLYLNSPSLLNLFVNSGLKYIKLPKTSDYDSSIRISGGSMFQRLNDLEYLDLSEVDEVTREHWTFSASFSELKSIKTLKVTDCFTPYPDSVPTNSGQNAEKGWYNLDNNTFYSMNIADYSGRECPFPKGTYIQFKEDTASFVNMKIDEQSKEENNSIVNPETGSKEFIILLVCFTTLIAYQIYAKKKSL